MTKYVVRSMSTTDSVRGSAPVPYHVYLLPPEKRLGAYWSSPHRAQLFASPQEAEAEAVRSNTSGYQVAPADDTQMPAYWDIRRTAA